MPEVRSIAAAVVLAVCSMTVASAAPSVDHATIAVDKTTFEAIRTSRDVRKLGTVRYYGEATRPGSIRLYFHHTYVIFVSAASPHVGALSIFLSKDHPVLGVRELPPISRSVRWFINTPTARASIPSPQGTVKDIDRFQLHAARPDGTCLSNGLSLAHGIDDPEAVCVCKNADVAFLPPRVEPALDGIYFRSTPARTQKVLIGNTTLIFGGDLTYWRFRR